MNTQTQNQSARVPYEEAAPPPLLDPQEAKALEIFDLLRQGKHAEFESFLEKGFDINGFYFNSDHVGTFLNKAIWFREVELVEYLLEKGSNPNLIYEGNNSYCYTGFSVDKDIDIVQKLIDVRTWILPLYPELYNIVDSLEYNEYATEAKVGELEREIYYLEQEEEEYRRYNSNNNNSRGYYSGWGGHTGGDQLDVELEQQKQQLEVIRRLIEILRPEAEKYVRKLKIKFFGSERTEELPFDIRASVGLLQTHIYNFFMDHSTYFGFHLLMPSFHIKEKRVMEEERALSDYNVRNGTQLIVTPIVSSQRHGGKRTRKARKYGRKTRYQRK